MQTDSNMDGIHQKKGNKAKRRKTWERFNAAFSSLLKHMDGFIAIEDAVITDDELDEITGKVERLDRTIVKIEEAKAIHDAG